MVRNFAFPIEELSLSTYLGVVGELGDREERLGQLRDLGLLRRAGREAVVGVVQRRAAGLECRLREKCS